MLSVSELRELAGKATKGPWKWLDAWPSDDGKLNPCRLAGFGEETVLEANSKSDLRLGRDDGTFIAVCREAVPSILDRLEAAEKALAGLVGRYMIPGVKGNDLWEAARAALSPPKKGE
jgi:hypothetical protein